MADQITAKDEGVKFLPHPEGQYGARCVDVIDLGNRVEQYQGKPPRVAHKCALVFDAGEKNPENGEPHVVHVEFTVSMFERAGLRLFLESWRGRSYREDEARDGVPLHKLEGAAALISVEHKESKGGRTYAKIKTISPLPKGMAPPELNGYKRAEFWAKKKEEYAAELAKAQPKKVDDDFRDFPEAPDAYDESDLPF